MMTSAHARSFAAVAALALLMVPTTSAYGADRHDATESSSEGSSSVVDYFYGALDGVSSARIDLRSPNCHDESDDVPRDVVLPVLSQPTDIRDLKRAFLNNKDLVVEGAPPLLHITVGSPLKAVLRTRLHRLSFDAAAQYSAAYAIRAIESTPEFMKAIGLHQPPSSLIFGVPFGVDYKYASKLPPTLDGVTVEKALDILATTFGGIVVYRECKDNPKYIDIRFFGFPRQVR